MMFRTATFLAGLAMAWMLQAQDAPAPASSAASPAHAMHTTQDWKPAGHDGHAMDMPKPAKTGTAATPAMPMASKSSMNSMTSKSSMPGMDMGSMQGGGPPPGARDPDYSDGIAFPPDRDAHMHGDQRVGMFLIDRLEYVHTADGHSGVLDGQAWYGGDLDKATLKFEADASGGRVNDARVEALWSHAVSAFWDTQLGVRHDGGDGPAREWAAFGVQGLAPYWFDVQATAYVGASGRTAARLDVEYEVLFTQRLILTPKFELNAYGRDDPQRGIGRGLSDASFGLRLRYEIRRRFAPYLGVTWSRRFSRSADLARSRGESSSGHAWVAGVRVWW